MLFIEAIETVKCLDEGVIESVADANIGSIIGHRLPRLDRRRAAVRQRLRRRPGGFVARARELAAQYGERFEPPPRWSSGPSAASRTSTTRRSPQLLDPQIARLPRRRPPTASSCRRPAPDCPTKACRACNAAGPQEQGSESCPNGAGSCARCCPRRCSPGAWRSAASRASSRGSSGRCWGSTGCWTACTASVAGGWTTPAGGSTGFSASGAGARLAARTCPRTPGPRRPPSGAGSGCSRWRSRRSAPGTVDPHKAEAFDAEFRPPLYGEGALEPDVPCGPGGRRCRRSPCLPLSKAATTCATATTACRWRGRSAQADIDAEVTALVSGAPR